MAIRGADIDVTDAPTALNDSGGGQFIYVRNDSGSDVKLGGEDVSDNGATLPTDGSISFKLQPGEVLYAITDDAATIGVLVSGAAIADD